MLHNGYSVYTMKAISLGWGVQSFTLAVMSALGELPAVALWDAECDGVCGV